MLKIEGSVFNTIGRVLRPTSVSYQMMQYFCVSDGNPDWRFIGKLNYSQSVSSLGTSYNGSYTEAVAGYGYRPVANDRLNVLAKYTYLYNMPSAGQMTVANTAAAFIQKDHIFSVDTLYELTQTWTIGGKVAHKIGQVSEDVVTPQFFSSRADLYIAWAD